MIVLIGIKKNTDLHIREQLAISNKYYEECLESISQILKKAVVISTCNRTEIYIDTSDSLLDVIDKVFESLNWDKSLKKYCFTLKNEEAVRHLFEVTSGFHSKISGEDQILGQVKWAYKKAKEKNITNLILDRLFQNAISCGKKFRTVSKLYEIPVSSASIVINKAVSSSCKKIMIIGFGEIGKLVYKYAMATQISEIIVVVRDKSKVLHIEDEKTKIINYNESKKILNDVDVIISCTSSNDIVIKKDDIKKDGAEIKIFDLAVPRDVDENIKEYSRVSLYNIDEISMIDDINKQNRKEKMHENRYVVDEAIDNFNKWINIREISHEINNIRRFSDKIVDARSKTFYNKCKDKNDIKLANLLIKSTSDVYANKAIEILKEEKLKGNEKECLRILTMIFS